MVGPKKKLGRSKSKKNRKAWEYIRQLRKERFQGDDSI